MWLLTNLSLSHCQVFPQPFPTVYSCSCLVFPPPACMLLLYCHLKPNWTDDLALPICCGTSTFPSVLLLLVHPTVNVDIKIEAGLSVSLSFFLSCECLRSTKGKLTQAEMASLFWTCHLRCVSYGHVALRACPNLRVLHSKNP